MSTASRPKKRFVGTKSARGGAKISGTGLAAHQIPADILNDPLLNQAIEQLPSNYSFEIHKTIHHIRKNGSQMVALQMPEGLQMFACTIADIIERFTTALTVIMGDVTYGACCIDDYTALALGCDMLVHYGHSCLVPIDTTQIKTLYVFVEIGIDPDHLAKTIRLNMPSNRHRFQENIVHGEVSIAGSSSSKAGVQLRLEGSSSELSTDVASLSLDAPQCTRLSLVSTIQFVAAVQRLKDDLTDTLADEVPAQPSDQVPLIEGSGVVEPTAHPSSHHRLDKGKYEISIPRSKPLSPGEILGCTAPRLSDVDALIYVGDGRFHLESIMIANPSVPAFRYDPYSKKLTRELYDHDEMRAVRGDAVRTAKRSIADADHRTPGEIDDPLWGVVLGTLGRQGSFKQLQSITSQLAHSSTPIPYMPILLSELSPAKLALFNQTQDQSYISTFIQTSCPRLSIDWGYAFDRPLLSPYECAVAIGESQGWQGYDGEQTGEGDYPMDFYTAGSASALARIRGASLATAA